MPMILTRLSRTLQVTLGMAGAVLVVSVFCLSGSVMGQQAASLIEESEIHAETSATPSVEAKARRWTILCEREDGTQGIFRVSSNLPDDASPLKGQLPVEMGEESTESSSQPLEDEFPEVPDEDPFDDPTLKCGRLLSLLAIFATAESLDP